MVCVRAVLHQRAVKTKTLHFHISGLVQGVGYRWAMVAAASRLGLDGWVRNRRDGTVEAIARGPEAALGELETWARQGPPGAVVSQVVCSPGDEEPARGFHQIPTL